MTTHASHTHTLSEHGFSLLCSFPAYKKLCRIHPPGDQCSTVHCTLCSGRQAGISIEDPVRQPAMSKNSPKPKPNANIKANNNMWEERTVEYEY